MNGITSNDIMNGITSNDIMNTINGITSKEYNTFIEKYPLPSYDILDLIDGFICVCHKKSGKEGYVYKAVDNSYWLHTDNHNLDYTYDIHLYFYTK